MRHTFKKRIPFKIYRPEEKNKGFRPYLLFKDENEEIVWLVQSTTLNPEKNKNKLEEIQKRPDGFFEYFYFFTKNGWKDKPKAVFDFINIFPTTSKYLKKYEASKHDKLSKNLELLSLTEEEKEEKEAYKKHNRFFIQNFVNTHLQYKKYKKKINNKRDWSSFLVGPYKHKISCSLNFWDRKFLSACDESKKLIISLEEKAKKYKKYNLNLNIHKSSKLERPSADLIVKDLLYEDWIEKQTNI